MGSLATISTTFDVKLFSISFVLVFLAEASSALALSVRKLGTRYRGPGILAGSFAACATSVALIALFGSLLGQLSQDISRGAGAIFFLFFAWLQWERSRAQGEIYFPDESLRSEFGRSFSVSFLVSANMSFGGLGQLTTLLLTMMERNSVTVTLGALSAYLLVILLSVNREIKQPESARKLIELFSATLFCAVGINCLKSLILR